MDERELKLNSLSRYSKVSPQFVLEEHGHCEVPAGCGGVVLRWRNPQAGIPFSMRVYSPGGCVLYVDGTTPSSSRPVLSFGEHVLAFAVSGFDPEFTALMFDGTGRQDPSNVNVRGSVPAAPEVSVRSSADGSWRYTLTEPDDDSWTHPGFDDAEWPALERRDVPPIADDQGGRMESYRLNALTETGAESLGVRGPGTRAWIRKVFEIPGPAQPRGDA